MKRAMLNNTLSILIAAICIVLLLSGIGYLYTTAVGSDRAVAKKDLELIETKINALESGQSTRFPVQGPSGWIIAGWSKGDALVPDKCYFKSCICACENPKETPFTAKDMNDIVNACQSKGICRIVDDAKVNVQSNFRINGEVTTSPAIAFSENLIELQVSKNADGVNVLYVHSDIVIEDRDSGTIGR